MLGGGTCRGSVCISGERRISDTVHGKLKKDPIATGEKNAVWAHYALEVGSEKRYYAAAAAAIQRVCLNRELC